MSGLRPFGVTVFRNPRGAPMASLGVHIDLHTPTVDLHLPLVTVQVGRNRLPWERFVTYHDAPRWHGHTDNCDHPVEEATRP